MTRRARTTPSVLPSPSVPSPRRDVARWWLLGILLAALLLRIGYLGEIAGHPDFVSPGVDAGFHQYWANAVVTGDWTPPPGAPDPEVPTTPYVRPPGYPYVLAAIYAVVGPSHIAPRLVNIALGLFNCYLAYRIGRRWYSPSLGLVWAAAIASYWGLVYFEGELQAATLLITLLMSAVYLLGRWMETPRPGYALAVGVLLGLAAITRPNALPLVPAVMFWMLLIARRGRGLWAGLGSVAILACAALAAIAPVTIRNYVVADDFVLISANAGVNLYIGNNPEAEGHAAGQVAGVGKFHSPYDYPRLARLLAAEKRRPMKYSEVSAEFTSRALGYMVQHAGDVAALTLRKALLFWGPEEIANNKEIHYERAFSPILRALPLNFPAVVALALLGGGMTLLSRRRCADGAVAMERGRSGGAGGDAVWIDERRGRDMAGLLAVIIGVLFLAILPFFVAGRYRVPLVPFLLFFAAWAICQVARDWFQRRWRRGVTAMCAGGIAFVLLSIPWARQEPSLARWHFDRGLAFGRVNRYAEALPHYETALDLEPDAVLVRLSLAHALRRLGRYDDAVGALGPNLASENPYTAETHIMLAEIRLQQGLPDAAIDHYRAALQRQGERVDVRRALGWLLATAGRFPEAVEELVRVLAATPHDAEGRLLLGMALYESGEIEEGRRQMDAAITQNPALREMAIAVGAPIDAAAP